MAQTGLRELWSKTRTAAVAAVWLLAAVVVASLVLQQPAPDWLTPDYQVAASLADCVADDNTAEPEQHYLALQTPCSAAAGSWRTPRFHLTRPHQAHFLPFASAHGHRTRGPPANLA